MTAASSVWLIVAVFMCYRSARRVRQTRRHRAMLRATGRNGVLITAASGNVRRAAYGLTAALIAIALTGTQALTDPTELRGAVLAGGVIAILALYALSGIRDDTDTARLLRYGTNDSGQALARQDTLVEVQSDVALVSEKVGVAVDAAHAAYEVANSVNEKILKLAERQDVSDVRADAAEARASTNVPARREPARDDLVHKADSRQPYRSRCGRYGYVTALWRKVTCATCLEKRPRN